MNINLADLLSVCYIKEHGTDEQKALLEKWREQGGSVVEWDDPNEKEGE